MDHQTKDTKLSPEALIGKGICGLKSRTFSVFCKTQKNAKFSYCSEASLMCSRAYVLITHICVHTHKRSSKVHVLVMNKKTSSESSMFSFLYNSFI